MLNTFYRNFDPQADDFTLKQAIMLEITNFEEEIKTISRDASIELKIETVWFFLNQCIVGDYNKCLNIGFRDSMKYQHNGTP